MHFLLYISAENQYCKFNFILTFASRSPTPSFREDGDYNIDFYPQDISRIAQSEADGPGAEKQLSVVKRPEAGILNI
jgi:hypothetical protein